MAPIAARNKTRFFRLEKLKGTPVFTSVPFLLLYSAKKTLLKILLDLSVPIRIPQPVNRLCFDLPDSFSA
jgi:hypothetical protein